MLQVRNVTGGDNQMLKIDTDTGEILWNTAIPTSIRNEQTGMNHSRCDTGTYGQMSSNVSFAIDTATGEVSFNLTGWPTTYNTAGASWWDGRSGNLIGAASGGVGIAKWRFFRGDGGSVSMDSIVSNLTLRGSLESGDIDVTAISGLSVPGYFIGRQSTIRAAIQPLASVFFFDGVESDYVLNYIPRDGKSSLVTIPQRDFAARSNDEPFNESRIQEAELPLIFTITYMDSEKDYQQGAQSAKRILNPTPAVRSQDELSLGIAAALTTDDAKRAAEKALYTSWIERSSFSVELPWTYVNLNPSDVVTLSLDSGVSFRTRIISFDLGVNYTIDMSSLSEDAAQYTSTVDADAGTGTPLQEFAPEAVTKLILLCSPLLRDSDDVGRTVSQFYFMMSGFGQPGWTAGTMFKSAEGTEYAQVGSSVDEMAWGTSQNALGDVTCPFGTDEVNTLRVYMNTGASKISSVTQLEMVNGANAAALVSSDNLPEIIQFRDVITNADGSFTLSGLLRGRRGTDVFTSGHSAGDTFILLEASTGDTLPLSLGEVDQTRFYRAVTSGQLFESAATLTKSSPGNDLKPYAPLNSTATLLGGDDIRLDWVRRTRVGGALKDGSGEVPLSEDSESYEIDVITGGVPTANSPYFSSTPTFTYTSAQQTADGFSPPLSTITVRIYQISAQVGRGFTKEVTLDVE